jgi:hypothetical protein
MVDAPFHDTQAFRSHLSDRSKRPILLTSGDSVSPSAAPSHSPTDSPLVAPADDAQRISGIGTSGTTIVAAAASVGGVVLLILVVLLLRRRKRRAREEKRLADHRRSLALPSFDTLGTAPSGEGFAAALSMTNVAGGMVSHSSAYHMGGGGSGTAAGEGQSDTLAEDGTATGGTTGDVWEDAIASWGVSADAAHLQYAETADVADTADDPFA